MTISTLKHIDDLSQVLSSVQRMYGHGDSDDSDADRGVDLKEDFVQLTSGPISTKSSRYRHFIEHLTSLRDTLKDALSHTDAIFDGVQMRLNEHPSKSHYLGIRSLPVEVLSDIFQLGYDSSDEQGFIFSISVSQVCRKFRLAALHTPFIWSCLWSTQPWYRTSQLIERTKGAGLTINIDGEAGENDIRKFLSIVKPHCSRWSEVHLNFKVQNLDTKEPVDTELVMQKYQDVLEYIPSNLQLPRLVELSFNFALLVETVKLPFTTWEMPKVKNANLSCVHLPTNLQNVTDCTFRLDDVIKLATVGTLQLQNMLRSVPVCKSLTICTGHVQDRHRFFINNSNAPFTNIVPHLRDLSADTYMSVLQYLFQSCIATEDLLSLHVRVIPINVGPSINDVMDEHRFDNLQKLVIELPLKGTFKFDITRFPSLQYLEIKSTYASKPVTLENFENVQKSNLKSISFCHCNRLDPYYICEIADKWQGETLLRFNYSRLSPWVMIRVEQKLGQRFRWCDRVEIRWPLQFS